MIARVLFFAALLLLEIVLVACFVKPDKAMSVVEVERRMVANTLGAVGESRIRERADGAFKAVFVESGFMRGSFRMVIPSADERRRSSGMQDLGTGAFTWMERRMQSIWYGVYGLIYRWCVFTAWLPFVLPVAIPAVIDGLVRREIKKNTFGYSSPVRYHTATHMLVLLAFVIPYYLLSPLVIHPIFTPVWAIVSSFFLAVFAANIQKRL